MKNVFVGNMNFQTSERDLRGLFELGEIGRVHIVIDRDTRLLWGFAFVEMADASEAAKTITGLNDKEFAGH